MKKILLMITATIMAFSFVHSQEKNNETAVLNKTEQEVMEMEKKWNEARAKTDRAAFERLIADDFVAFAPQDQVGSKTGVVKNYRAPNLEAIENVEVKVRIYGDTAVVTGWNIRKWRLLDREKSPQERFTNVWVRRNGQWQIVSTQWALRKEPEFKALAALGCEQEISLKSPESDIEAYIQFTNSTNQPVMLHRLNLEGKRQQITEINPGQSGYQTMSNIKQYRTFLNRSFVVTDKSGKCLGIYQPAPEAGLVIIK